MKVESSLQICEKYLNIKFHENSFSGSLVVSCKRTEEQTEMTGLILAFHYFANAPKNAYSLSALGQCISYIQHLNKKYKSFLISHFVFQPDTTARISAKRVLHIMNTQNSNSAKVSGTANLSKPFYNQVLFI
jgi:hypothetical protein